MPGSSQPKFKVLVANFSKPMPSTLKGSLPEVGPVKIRTGFEFRHLPMLGSTLYMSQTGQYNGLVTRTYQEQFNPFVVNPPTLPTGDVEVVDNNFQGTSASLWIGPFELAANRDFVVGGGPAATAANIGAAINNLPGYSASVAGSIITVSGPAGATGDSLRFKAVYRGGTRNFDFTYVRNDYELGYAANNPVLPPTILP
jgi:hypothetical protein